MGVTKGISTPILIIAIIILLIIVYFGYTTFAPAGQFFGAANLDEGAAEGLGALGEEDFQKLEPIPLPGEEPKPLDSGRLETVDFFTDEGNIESPQGSDVELFKELVMGESQ